MKDLPVRKHIRLKNYDYSSTGCYFITICIKNRHELLSRVVVGDAHPGVPHDAHPGVPSVILTQTGEMVKQHIDNASMIYSTLAIDKYIIMPNHIHMIVVIENGTPGCASDGTPRCASPTKSTLANMLNALKSLTSRQFGESTWQRSYHDHIIRTEDEYRKIWEYINENPARWEEDCYYN